MTRNARTLGWLLVAYVVYRAAVRRAVKRRAGELIDKARAALPALPLPVAREPDRESAPGDPSGAVVGPPGPLTGRT